MNRAASVRREVSVKLYYVEVVYRAYVLADAESSIERLDDEITGNEDPYITAREVQPGDAVNAGWEMDAYPYCAGVVSADEYVTLAEVWPVADEVSDG
jgi:hypothetical protein